MLKSNQQPTKKPVYPKAPIPKSPSTEKPVYPQFVEQLDITDNTLFFGKKVFRLKVVIH
jgi:hypothetical protein